jgi:hypothetical protein
MEKKYLLEHQEYEEGEAEYDAADYPYIITTKDDDGDQYIVALVADEDTANKIMAALNAS